MNQGHVYHRILGPEAKDVTLLDYLEQHFQHSPRARWQQHIAAGQVRIDSTVVQGPYTLQAGQQLSWHRPPWEEPQAPCSFAVLHDDGDVVVVAKPVGLPTLPGGGLFLEKTLLHQLRRLHGEVRPLHRLGRGTSGLVLCARSREARQTLTEDLRHQRIRKTYRALATGRIEQSRGTIQVPIARQPYQRLGWVHAAAGEGKASRTDYEVLEERGDVTLVRAWPITGRPHQIRIHLAALGHPLLKDPLYGVGGTPPEDGQALPSDLGYSLHAEQLEFLHPGSQQPMTVFCLPPPPLRSLSEALQSSQS